MNNNKNVRLDTMLVQKGLVGTKNKAQAIILTGGVMVNGRCVDKPGAKIRFDAEIEIKAKPHPFVSRGGQKLAHALDHFHIDPHGLVCMDVGASTGGFTDCLLQRGALKVYAIDVGYGQLDWRLRNDERVMVLERTNIRKLEPGTLDPVPTLAVVDTSFISLKIVIPAVLRHLSQDSKIIALIKPQFEVGRHNVGKGGIVKDQALHENVLKELSDFFVEKQSLTIEGIVESPILGAKGNKEFLIALTREKGLCDSPKNPIVVSKKQE